MFLFLRPDEVWILVMQDGECHRLSAPDFALHLIFVEVAYELDVLVRDVGEYDGFAIVDVFHETGPHVVGGVAFECGVFESTRVSDAQETDLRLCIVVVQWRSVDGVSACVGRHGRCWYLVCRYCWYQRAVLPLLAVHGVGDVV